MNDQNLMDKRKRRKMTWKTMGIYYAITMIIVIPVSYQFHEPTRYGINQAFGICEIRYRDTPAIPREFYELPLDVYVVGTPAYSPDLSDDQIRAIINGTSDIWKPYGIELHIFDKINRPNMTLNDEDVLIGISGSQEKDAINLGKKVVGDKINDTNFNVVKVFFIKSFYNRTTYLIDTFGIKLIPLEEYTTGKGLNGQGVSAAYVANDKNISWALAHELGHVLNNNDIPDYAGRLNLMTTGGCIKERYFPTIINEEQYMNLRRKITSLQHN